MSAPIARAGSVALDRGFVVEARHVGALLSLAGGKTRFTRSLVPVEW